MPATIGRKARPTATISRKARPTATIARGSGPEIPTDGLLVHYAFNEGSGQVLNDDSGNSHDGQLGSTSGSDANDPTWITEGLRFDGSDDTVINTTLTDAEVTGAITLISVANLDVGSNEHVFANKHSAGSGGGTQNPFDYRTDNAATPRMNLIRANTGVGVWGGPNAVVGSWRMYSVTAPAAIETAPTFYVNTTSTTGSSLSVTGSGAPTGSNAALRIGERPAGSFYLDGDVAYTLIYSRELTEKEIGEVYRVLKARLASRGISL